VGKGREGEGNQSDGENGTSRRRGGWRKGGREGTYEELSHGEGVDALYGQVHQAGGS